MYVKNISAKNRLCKKHQVTQGLETTAAIEIVTVVFFCISGRGYTSCDIRKEMCEENYTGKGNGAFNSFSFYIIQAAQNRYNNMFIINSLEISINFIIIIIL